MLLAQTTPPSMPARPPGAAPVRPQTLTPTPPAPTQPVQQAPPATGQPPAQLGREVKSVPVEFWVPQRSNTEVVVALVGLAAAIVLGYFLRNMIMKMTARRRVDPLRAGALGSAVWLILFVATAVFVVGFLYQIFPLTQYLVVSAGMLALCLVFLLIAWRSVRRARS